MSWSFYFLPFHLVTSSVCIFGSRPGMLDRVMETDAQACLLSAYRWVGLVVKSSQKVCLLSLPASG